MKKIIYATQMFALIAMFPMIVILDLNRVTPPPAKTDLPSNSIETARVKNRLSGTPGDKMGIGAFSIRIETLVTKQSF